MFKTITGRSPPKIKIERKKEKNNKELSSRSRRGLYPPRNVKATVVPNLGFPSRAQLQGGRRGVCGPKRKRDRRYLDCKLV